MNIRFRSGYFALSAVLAVALLGSCAEATIVGNDLLSDEVQSIGFTDSLRLVSRTVKEDSVLTHSSTSGSQILRHVMGNLDDPFFGKSESVISSQMFLNGIGSDFLDNIVDSVVIKLAYAPEACYGDLDATVSVQSYRLLTDLELTRTYFSNESFPRNFVPMARKTDFVPSITDSVSEIGPGGSLVLRKPHLRIPCTDDFINILTSQSEATFQFQDSFASWFRGMQIEMNGGNNTMLAFDLNDELSGMTVYYRRPDTSVFRQYTFVFRGLFFAQVQLATFDHDYTGSVVGEYLDDPGASDSLVFVQSMSGVNTQFEVPALDTLDNVLINQAILEFFIADLPENDTALFPLVNRLQTRTENIFGELTNSRDVSLALRIQEIDQFGGTVVFDRDTGRFLYRMNVTASVQDIVNGVADNRIFVSSFQKQNEASRVVLYGPGHDTYPARLKITYTRTP